MIIEQTRCAAEVERLAFENWYRERLEKVKAAGLATRAHLYRNIRDGELRPGVAGYMALYERDAAAPAVLDAAALRWDPPLPSASVVKSTVVALPPPPRGPRYLPGYGSHGTPGKTGTAPVYGVIVVQCVYPGEPRWAKALNRWYNDHVRWVVGNGANHTAYRYVDVAPDADGGRIHWAFYESGLANFKVEIAKIVAAGRAEQKQAPASGRHFFPHYAKMISNVTFETIV
jgi:hypothetical protein